MTQDEIILLADASGISLYGMGKDRDKFIQYLQAFAKLVAKHTLMNIDPSKFMSYHEGVEAGRFAEREACARVCDDRAFRFISESPFFVEMHGLADAIRARGEA